MTDMIIAIDGFSEADNIKEISRLGIDWIGLDFVADSPRRVRQLASLSGMLPDSPLLECAGLAPGARLMGVFRDEMPQTIVTSIYNFHLDLVRLEGEESTVLIDNLRRTVDPDIRCGLQIVKTLRIERREDLLRAADYAGHADYLLLDPVEAAQEWLTDWEAPVPFLLRGGKKEAEGASLPDFHHPRLAGYCLGEEMEQAPGRIDATKVQRLLDNL